MSFPGVLCSGNIVYDILVRPVDAIQWGTTTWVESIDRSLGGNGANTSYTLGKLGVPVRLLGLVGADPFGAELLERLRRAGVDTATVGISHERTATSVALVQSSGARLFLHRPGASQDAFETPVEFTDGLIRGCSRYHLANVFALRHLRRNAPEILRRAHVAGLAVSLDTAWDPRGEWMTVLGPCLPYLDILFVNQDEACMLTGAAEPAAAARILRAEGAKVVVVKLGPAGCSVLTSEGAFESPGFAVDAVDTTGAGDCFAGAFLAALARGADLNEAARVANAAGAMTVGKLGAVEGIGSWEETRAFAESQSWR
jgi:sugar/nucleoside kinase (ribokinase family)